MTRPTHTTKPIRVFIENEAGSSIKNDYDQRTHQHLGRSKVSAAYPFAYGFAVDTKSGDGDNVDCFVVTDHPLKSGDCVDCYVVSMLEQIEDNEIDHKILCVVDKEGLTIDAESVARIRDFLQIVFSHLPNKILNVGELRGQKEALAFIEKSNVN